MSQVPVRLYTREHRSTWSRAAWREMIGELIEYKFLAWRLFLRDFLTVYRQTLMGVVWSVMVPLASVMVFSLLNEAGVLHVGDVGVPYPAYALLGVTVWQFFASGAVAVSGAVVRAGDFVTKVSFPREVLLLSALGRPVIDLLIRIVLLAVVFAWYGVLPSWSVLLAPVALVPIVCLMLAIGIGLAIVNVVVRDVSQAMGLAMGFLMLLTPVVYAEPRAGMLAVLTKWNPLSPLFATVRDVVLHGTVSQPWAFGLVGVGSIVLFGLSWRFFHAMEGIVTERL